MPATPIYALPYPAATDPADVPADMGALANRVEAVIVPGTASGQTLVWDNAAKKWVATTVEAWREIGSAGQPVFENGWINVGGAAATAAFYKDPDGVVHIKGLIRSGANTAVAFTLPAGYRPAQDLRFVQTGYDGASERVARIDILAASGQVAATVGGAAGAIQNLTANAQFRV